jgi:hypothetical protein
MSVRVKHASLLYLYFNDRDCVELREEIGKLGIANPVIVGNGPLVMKKLDRFGLKLFVFLIRSIPSLSIYFSVPVYLCPFLTSFFTSFLFFSSYLYLLLLIHECLSLLSLNVCLPLSVSFSISVCCCLCLCLPVFDCFFCPCLFCPSVSFVSVCMSVTGKILFTE